MILFIGICMFIRMVIVQNIPNKIGIQGITWLYLPTPFGALTIYNLLFDSSPEKPDPYRFMDNALVMVMIAFITFALTMGGSVVDNIIKNTSQPEKMKNLKP